jgi:hypothetical protein
MNARPQMLSRRTIAVNLCILSMIFQRGEALAESATVAVRLRADSTVLQSVPPGVRQHLQVSQDRSPAAKELAAQAPPEKAVPIILIAVGVMSIPVLYSSILEMIRQTFFGGVIIDARTKPVSVINSKSVSANMVLYIAPDGKSQYYSAFQFKLSDLDPLAEKR